MSVTGVLSVLPRERASAALRTLVCAAVLWLLASPAVGQAPREQSFQTLAPHALLMDEATGTVLFEKAADDPVAPASMAKMMTATVLFDAIKHGRVKLDDEFGVSENAWRKGGAPSGGSAMFLGLGSRAKVVDLIQGLVVQSGNDAAITIAEGIAGTEANFAGLMTKRARELGLARSTFMNATGLPDDLQRTTARELAFLAKHIIDTYPDLYKYFGQREFTWGRIRQQNRNPLIAMEMGADGLKTGYIQESGYSLTGSAVQNGQRLIVVVTGLKTAKDRSAEARKLLDWGFRAFEAREIFPDHAVIGEAKVFGGERGFVPLVANGAVKVLIPRGSTEKLAARIVYMGPLRPPVKAGAEIARLKVVRGETQALDVPLYAGQEDDMGGLSRRALDAFVEFGTGFVRRAFSKT